MRVLLIDDAPDICWAYEKQLRALGHEVIALQDGRKALDYAKQFFPDAIVVDICMPYLDGWEVGEELRADAATQIIRLVAVTAMTGRACERRSAAAGFDAHFGKPIRLEQWPRVLNSNG